MSMALYKQGLKGSWKLFAVLAAVIAMYFTVIVGMYDPELNSALGAMMESMPELMAAMGMTQDGGTLVEFMASYLYGFLMLVFPMVYAILTANRLVAKQVDHGSMVYLLAAPVRRGRIVVTQLAVLLTGVVALVAFAAGVGMASAAVLFPGELDIPRYLLLNLGALCLQLLIAGICFLFACIFNDTRYSLSFGAGIPALCFIIQMLANVGEKLNAAKYATFFTLYSPAALLRGETWAYAGIAVLAGAALVLFCAAAAVFTKKDIPV